MPSDSESIQRRGGGFRVHDLQRKATTSPLQELLVLQLIRLHVQAVRIQVAGANSEGKSSFT